MVYAWLAAVVPIPADLEAEMDADDTAVPALTVAAAAKRVRLNKK